MRSLASLMRSDGADVWFDDDEDGEDNLADRRLIEKIAHAVFHARHIVVCVSSKSTLSEWMKAEFTIASSEQSKWGYRRVLVALLDEQANVPEMLVGCPVFNAWDPNADNLSEFVKCGNRLDFNPEEVKSVSFEALFTRSDDFVSGGSADAEFSCVRGILRLPWNIDKPDSHEFDMSLQSLRIWIARAKRSDLDSVPGLASMLLHACFRPAFSKNKDNRANAIGAMAFLADFGYAKAGPQLLYFLSNEWDAGVISMALP
jgi:hypothetical protein